MPTLVTESFCSLFKNDTTVRELELGVLFVAFFAVVVVRGKLDEDKHDSWS